MKTKRHDKSKDKENIFRMKNPDDTKEWILNGKQDISMIQDFTVFTVITQAYT